MKAIVLSCDRYRTFAKHTVLKYRELWPSHPFEFRIPYQANPDDQMASAEWIRCAEPIGETVKSLIADLPADEWIYWCIDDKYPVQLDVEHIATLPGRLQDDEFSSVGAVAFCRCRSWLHPSATIEPSDKEGFVRRRTWHHIWLHQFLRVGVLREFFAAMPDFRTPKEMDELKFRIPLPVGQELLVTEENHAVFGESTSRGKVTANCAASLAGHGYQVDEEFLPPSEPRKMGVLIGD